MERNDGLIVAKPAKYRTLLARPIRFHPEHKRTKQKTRWSFRSSGFFVVLNFNQRAVTVTGIVSWALPPALSVTTTFN
jgi:hypothetical protein